MTLIRAAVCRAFGAPLSLEDVRLADPGPGEAEVAIEACAICQSDISYMLGGWPAELPAVWGHEAVGRVLRGPADLLGQRVLVTLLRACGRCHACATGQPALCAAPPHLAPLTLADGTPLAQGLNCGAFAERVVVHHSQLAPIGDALPAASACLLSCGVITGLGAAVNTARVRPGDAVVVIGAGGVGLNAIQGARLAGAARIVAVDLSDIKLDDARLFGATDTVRADAGRPWQAARAAMGRAADTVIVTVGAVSAYESASRYLRPGGRVVMVGMPHSGDRAQIEPVVHAMLQQGFQGSMMGETVLARDIPWVLDLHAQGRLKLDELVSGTWPLAGINEAIAATRAGASRRNVIVFP